MRTGGSALDSRIRARATVHAEGNRGVSEQQQGAAPWQSGPLPSFARHFLEMRQHTRLSVDEVAGWLNTTPDVIAALEAGAVQRLPLWPEISRVVTAYATPLGIDPNALLHLIADEFESVMLGRSHPQATPLPQSSPPVADHEAREDAETLAPARTMSAAILSAFRKPSVIVSMASLAVLAVVATQTPVLKSMTRLLPAPASNYMRSATDSFSGLFATKREGLTWIEAADPRSRRADKLAVHRR
jgi:hypothetical protein